jgi:hypothetical protein
MNAGARGDILSGLYLSILPDVVITMIIRLW